MRQRISIVLVLVALAPLLIAAGSNPPVDSNGSVKFSGPMVNAVVVINPNNTGGITGDYATLWLQRGGQTAGAVFRISQEWGLGCNTTVGSAGEPGTLSDRFINHALSDWVPTSGPQGNVLGALFTQLGIPIGTPVITDISNAECTTNPSPFPAANANNQNFLSFQAAVQFLH